MGAGATCSAGHTHYSGEASAQPTGQKSPCRAAEGQTHGCCLSWVPSEARPETRIQVQVGNLGGDPRRPLQGSGDVNRGRWEVHVECLLEQVSTEGTVPLGSQSCANTPQRCPTLDKGAGTLSSNSPFVLHGGSTLQHSRPPAGTNARRQR